VTKEKFTGIHWNVNFIFHTYHLGFRSVLRENALIFLKVYSSSPTQRCIMRTRYLKALENKRLSLATFLDASASSTRPRECSVFRRFSPRQFEIYRTYESGKHKILFPYLCCARFRGRHRRFHGILPSIHHSSSTLNRPTTHFTLRLQRRRRRWIKRFNASEFLIKRTSVYDLRP
jgi:hypothetical protein